MLKTRLTHKFINEQWEKDNYTLLEDTYINSSTKMKYRCPKGHEHSITWDNWKSGKRCPYCAGQGKPTIEYLKEQFKSNGCILLEQVYVNANTKLYYICPNGHENFMSWSNWKAGKKCVHCYKIIDLNIDYIRSIFNQEDYICLSDNIENSKTKLDFICPKGHKHNITWNDWQQGNRCFYCSNRVKPIISDIRNSLVVENYILSSKEYINCETKLNYICPKGHQHSITWNHWLDGNRCPKCSNNGTSKFEQQIKDFILHLNIDIIENDRTTIKGIKGKFLELDILLPCKTKAIECNGVYWHNKPEVIKRDDIKRKVCKKLGIDLLIITDLEWKEDINKCEDKIKTFLM